jgi:hypothetical protein
MRGRPPDDIDGVNRFKELPNRLGLAPLDFVFLAVTVLAFVLAFAGPKVVQLPALLLAIVLLLLIVSHATPGGVHGVGGLNDVRLRRLGFEPPTLDQNPEAGVISGDEAQEAVDDPALWQRERERRDAREREDGRG